jgi:hypothetical protein
MWTVRDLLQAMNRNLVNRRFWKNYLCSIMDLSPGHSSIIEIISHCDLEMVREAFMHWIHDLRRDRPLKPGMQRDMELLAEKAGRICFFRSVPYSRRLHTPLSVAMQTSRSFSKIRELLQNSPFQIGQVVQEELELCNTGWTEDTLMALFNEEVGPCTGPGQFICKFCGFWQRQFVFSPRVSRGKEPSQIETWYSPRFTSGRDGDSEEENMGPSGCRLSGEDMLHVSEGSA